MTLTNLNEPPVWINPPTTIWASPSSPQPVGFALRGFVADPDGISDASTFAIVSGNAAGRFTIDSTTGQLFAVAPGLTCPNSVCPVYNLTISATDKGVDGSPLSVFASVGVVISPQAVRPILDISPNTTVFVLENSPPGTSLADFVALSAPVGSALTFALQASGPDSTALAWPFAMTTIAGKGMSETGLGKVSVAWDGVAGSVPWLFLDFENGHRRYAAVVSIMDTSFGVPLIDVVSITIEVQDAPEAPYFAPSRVAGAGSFILVVAEGSAAGTSAAVDAARSTLPPSVGGGLRALDDDVGDSMPGNLTYA